MLCLIHVSGKFHYLIGHYKSSKVCPCGYSPVINTVMHYLYEEIWCLTLRLPSFGVTQKYIISPLNFFSWNYFLIVNHSPLRIIQTFSSNPYYISTHWYNFNQIGVDMFILCLAKCSHSFTSFQSTYGVFLSNSPFPKALTYLDRLSVPLSKTKVLKLFWLTGVLENLTK